MAISGRSFLHNKKWPNKQYRNLIPERIVPFINASTPVLARAAGTTVDNFTAHRASESFDTQTAEIDLVEVRGFWGASAAVFARVLDARSLQVAAGS